MKESIRRTPVRFLIPILALLMLGLVGCQQAAQPTTLRMAVLPILDTFPMYVADAEGYFAEEGVSVEFVPVASAQERDQLIQAGEADGMVNELLSTMFYNADGPEVLTVSFARVPTPDYPHFYILSAAQSGITAPADLVSREVGISEGTIIEYSTERLLESAGIAPDDVTTVAVPRIPDRLALLASGELAAANMPDPLAALAMAGGANMVLNDAKTPEYGGSVITFRREVVEEDPEAIAGFLRALGRAVTAINSDKNQFNDLLVAQQLLPEPLQGNYTLPDYPSPSVPPEAQWNDMHQWARNKGYLQTDVAYATSVSDDFLP